MLKRYREMPSQIGVVRELNRLSKQWGVETGLVQFVKSTYPQCTDEGLQLIEPWYCSEHHGMHDCNTTDDEERARYITDYWLMVFHEFAHWVQQSKTGYTSHDALMGSIVFAIASEAGLPMDRVYRSEVDYKPRMVYGGLARMGRVVRQHLKETL